MKAVAVQYFARVGCEVRVLRWSYGSGELRSERYVKDDEKHTFEGL